MTTSTSPLVVMGRDSFAPQDQMANQRYYRLNRRGKFVIGSLVTLLLSGGFFLFSSLFGTVVQAAETDSSNYEYVHVIVLPGDSLWEIASEFAPNADPRAVIDLVQSVNGLDSTADLQVGQTLLVPKI